MKKIKMLGVALVAMCLFGMASNAGAVASLKSDGLGDALLFPVFNGYVDNYYTITNTSNQWVQSHVRFRGALWSAELLDFDIILSPGDVFVFRLADLDGDGAWELDQTLDEDNWTYTGLLEADRIKEGSYMLEPTAGTVTADELEHQRRAGYIEVIGEAVLNGMTKTVALAGTSAWKWCGASEDFDIKKENYIITTTLNNLSDVGNVLSGSAFITVPGSDVGLAYNAEAIQDFRTTTGFHRLDTYAADHGVILHNDNSLADDGAYVYRFEDTLDFEKEISFNNTWGPTLADGDDLVEGIDNDDAFDVLYQTANSITEVEDALKAGGQVFYSYYFDSDALISSYFVHFPTKFYHAEDQGSYGANSLQEYIDSTVRLLIAMGIELSIEVWDIFEHSGETTTEAGNVSPALPGDKRFTSIGHELNLFTIDFLKRPFESDDVVDSYTSGRVVVDIQKERFPGLAYTFEVGSNLGSWRSMQR